MRDRLVARGVRFVRAEVASIRDAAALVPCDMVVNASGQGARTLADVQDTNCTTARGQTMLVKCASPAIHLRHTRRWEDYTYVIPRPDGTAIIGGCKEYGSINPHVDEELKRDIHRRAHQLVPKYIPERYEDLEIVRDLVGLRPERTGGIRTEAEVIGGVPVVHAYGVGSSGYVFSWGVAAKVKELVGVAMPSHTQAAAKL
jgi:glycine/D-amino acid oxidase-like deaminating enzyme